MKRILSLFCVLILCSCSSGSQLRFNLKDLKFTAVITCFDEIYECETETFADGSINVTVGEPPELEGIKYSFKNGKISFQYKGLKYDPPNGTLPSEAAVKVLFDIIDICNSGASAERNGGNYIYKGDIPQGGFKLMLSPSGLPIKAQLNDSKYSVEFSGVTVK